jgi:transposase, IS5 family
MRKVIDEQMKLGEVDVSRIEFDPRSRDEIPQLLMGLQHIYCDLELRTRVFALLEEAMPAGRSEAVGRPGMDLWRVLVLGTVKLNCEWNYDKVKEMADNHLKIREMLGHVPYLDDTKYPLQTLRDNVSLLTPELLEKINVLVVQAGHCLVKKTGGDEKLVGRCDSFVVETDVHYPTDINLLLDAMRKIIVLVARLCARLDLSGWRQSFHNAEKVRRLCRKIGKMKRSKSKDEGKQVAREKQIRETYQAYLDLCGQLVDRAEQCLVAAFEIAPDTWHEIAEIRHYIDHAYRQMDQVQRRVLAGEKIEHDEKVFSIFEQHTEWISKGKAGVPQELGLRVCILEDQYGFVLHHMVMAKQTDEQVAVPMVEATLADFPQLAACSFDKGFYTPTNRRQLRELLGSVVMPKKGRLSAADKELEYSPEFVEARQKHSAVESGINALENHGLRRCRDSGIDGFQRYVGLAVLARNVQKLGRVLLDREQERLKRLGRRRQADARLAEAS